MAASLKHRNGERFRMTARVVQRGGKPGWNLRYQLPYLLADVRDAKTDELLLEECWCLRGRWADGIKPGDRISFDARVTPKLQGYRQWWLIPQSRYDEVEWRLSVLSHTEVLSREPE